MRSAPASCLRGADAVDLNGNAARSWGSGGQHALHSHEMVHCSSCLRGSPVDDVEEHNGNAAKNTDGGEQHAQNNHVHAHCSSCLRGAPVTETVVLNGNAATNLGSGGQFSGKSLDLCRLANPPDSDPRTAEVHAARGSSPSDNVCASSKGYARQQGHEGTFGASQQRHLSGVGSSVILDTGLEMPNFKTIMENLTELTEVHLGNVQINSSSLQPLLSLSSLRALSLYRCGLSAPIPRWVCNISEEIVLFGNQFTGELPSSVNISSLSIFTVLDNLLTGKVPSWLFSLPSPENSNLANNRFSGQLGEVVTSHLLSWIDLSGNRIQGSIPPSIFGLMNLVILELSSNNLSGMVQLDMFCRLSNLALLDLSHNSLSVTMSNNTTNFTPSCPKLRFLERSSCNITEFPDFLRTQDSLQLLDLSNTEFRPLCVRSGSKKLQGIIPSAFGTCSSLMTLDLNGNYLEGQLPLSLHSCEELEVLDVGNNKLNDTFPYWLGVFPSYRSWCCAQTASMES
ncbi:hypothetical protein Ancab_024978 [Ancistrocladus abbreviatus]